MNRRAWIGGWLPVLLVARSTISAASISSSRDDAASPPARRETVTRKGKVRFLADTLALRKLEADPEPAASQIILEQADGTVVPLLANAASKCLWLDERLRNRPAELRGWLHAGLPYLEVTNVRVEEQGSLRTPEYYCDVCTITTRYPQACPCCQGELALRYQPRP